MGDHESLLREALEKAADHFDEIARKAEHWQLVLEHNELAEGRWSQIKRHARHLALVARDVLAKTA